MHSASNVAKHVLTQCQKLGRRLDNLQLQKILYFVWADYYKKTKKRLFYNRIEAWHYGPVIPDVYREYSYYVASKIRTFEQLTLDDEHIDVINNAIEKYSGIPVGQLINRTHEYDTPWSKYRSDASLKTIPFEEIEHYCDAHD